MTARVQHALPTTGRRWPHVLWAVAKWTGGTVAVVALLALFGHFVGLLAFVFIVGWMVRWAIRIL